MLIASDGFRWVAAPRLYYIVDGKNTNKYALLLVRMFNGEITNEEMEELEDAFDKGRIITFSYQEVYSLIKGNSKLKEMRIVESK